MSALTCGSSPPNSELHQSSSPSKILYCAVCKKVQNCSSDQLLRYTRTNWPRFCSEVMALFIPGEQLLSVNDEK